MKIFYCFTLVLFFSLDTTAQSSRDSLNQYVAELQKTPSDDALRTKIILISHRIKPPLATPEEAERFMARGKAATELAKSASDYADAIIEFTNATLAAPWLGLAYYNLAVVQESAEEYDAAIKNYKFYLLAEPNTEDANDVKNLIFGAEYKKEKTASNAVKEAAENKAKEEKENAEKEDEIRRNSFEGEWNVTYSEENGSPGNYVGDKVMITKREDGNYSVSGPSWFEEQAVFSNTSRILKGQVTPSLTDLIDIFKTTPSYILSQAEGKVVFTCSLTLSDDGTTIYVERDNCQINYLGKPTNTFTNVEHRPAFYKYTFKRASNKPKSEEEIRIEAEQRRIYNATTIKIGKQEWMKKNLNVDHYRNGDPIPQVQDPTEWKKLKTGAWCYYANDPANGEKYGKLYNWYAVNDPRGLAPVGWHIPSNDEWEILINHFGGAGTAKFSAPPKYAGKRMKSASGWEKMDDNGTDEGGFNGLPAGQRQKNGSFNYIGKFAAFWSSSTFSQPTSILLNSIGFKDEVFLWAYPSEMGISVRCIVGDQITTVAPANNNNSNQPKRK